MKAINNKFDYYLIYVSIYFWIHINKKKKNFLITCIELINKFKLTNILDY